MRANYSEVINGLNIYESSKAIIPKIVAELLFVIAEKYKLIEEQSLIIKSQGAEILELQEQIKMDSSNSSLHPSSDMSKKRKKLDDGGSDDFGISNRSGKSGHKCTTLNQVKNSDRIKKIMLEQCSYGSGDLRVTGSY